MLVAAVSVLLVYGAVGMLVAAWIASPPTGPGFWRLSLLLAVAGLGLGLGLRLSSLSTAIPDPGNSSLALIAACVVALVLFGVRLGLEPESPSWRLLGVAAVTGMASLVTDRAVWPAEAEGVALVVYVLGMLTTATALGSVAQAMILAHWYLIEPSMPVAPLNRVLGLFLGTEGLALILLVLVVGLHLPEWQAAEGGLLRSFVLGDALFVAVRGVLGVLAPLGLGWMTWKTVQIRSIQSATGILYAAIVFVLFGEVISVYLSLATGQPF